MKHADNILRVGGVGTGRIFQWAHLNAYPRLMEKARLVGFFDINPTRARQAREKYIKVLEKYATAHPESAEAVKNNLGELRAHESLKNLLNQVDVIDVCTTTRGRMASAMAALEMGVHSMVEKPMARTWIEADRAARCFTAHSQVYCQLNDDNVFEPKYRMLHALLAQGEIGKVQSISLTRGSGLDATSVLKSQASALENGGGCLMDYGSHGLAGAWYALGLRLRPVKVEAIKIAVRFPNRVLEGEPFVLEVEDDAHIKVLFEEPETGSWTTVFLEATWCGGEIGLGKDKSGGQSDGYLRIEGDEGVIDASMKDRVRILHWDSRETVLPLREHPGETISFYDEIETFIDCIRTGTPPEIDVNFGAEIIAVIGAAYLSASRKQAVTLEEFKDFSRGYVEKYGDNDKAEESILTDLLKPYRREQ